jgi:pimeloyl-ACP methyl ester carboxylesterase
MAKLVCMLCVAAMLGSPLQSARNETSIEGYWEGAVVRDGSVRVVAMKVYREGEGLKAELRLPDWMTESIPPIPVTRDGNTVRFSVDEESAALAIDSQVGEMIGTFGSTVPPTSIHLKRGLAPREIPINREDVSFKNAEVTLAGTLVTPTTRGPHPAIVWIHGRGKGTRRDFAGWARIFAERGVASLIYDKRGVGQSTGDHDASGMNDFADDGLAAVELLAARGEIDPKQIGLRGSSAGGWISSIVATRSKVPIAFVVTSVGPAESVMDQQIHVAKHLMLRSGVPFTDDEYAAAAAHMGLVTGFAYTGKGWETLQASVAKAKQARWARFVDLPESQDYEDIVWVRLNQYDPGPDLRRMKAPYLALFGGDDFVVPPTENVDKLKKYLAEAGNTDVTTVVIPKAGHGMSLSGEVRRLEGKPLSGFYWLWGKHSAEAVQITVDWVLAHVRVAGN